MSPGYSLQEIADRRAEQEAAQKALTIVRALANTDPDGWLSRKEIHASLAEFRNPSRPRLCDGASLGTDDAGD